MYYGYEDYEENKEKIKTFAVKDINLVYRLLDENLLEFLVGVSSDWTNPSKKCYIFQLNTYVQDCINSYYMGSNKNNKRKQR